MGWKCCVPLCRSGYNIQQACKNPSGNSTNVHISFFAFPHDQALRDKWIRSIKREDIDKFGQRSIYVPTASSRICSLHFLENDFIKTSQDTNNSRSSKRARKDLKILQLKSSAVPSVFNNFPSYYASTTSNATHPSHNREESTAAVRMERENARMEILESEFLAKDNITDFDDLLHRLPSISLPKNYTYISISECIVFSCFASDSFDHTLSPRCQSFVRIFHDLSFDCYFDGIKIHDNRFSYLLKTKDTVSSETELANLLAKCKSSPISERNDFNSIIEEVKNLLKDAIDLVSNDVQSNTVGIIKVFIEQLTLSQIPKNGRRFSTGLIVTAYLWYMNSRSLYLQLKDLFCLPSIRRLQQLSSGSQVDASTVDQNYLQMRASMLGDKEKIVLLIIDEIDVASRLELVGSRLLGMTSDGKLAKTVLVFMIQSTCSKYKDVVKIVPIENLNAELLLEEFHSVMESLKDTFFVIAVSTDNHVVNRSMYLRLSGGQLKTKIKHPYSDGRYLYLLMDPTHNFKNAYNNWVNKGRFSYPDGYPNILNEQGIANFNHIISLYEKEKGLSLTSANKLTKECLNPSSISRTSPRHAIAVFHESTIRSLRYYNEPGWEVTSQFVSFIGDLWKILNVKSVNKGIRKRDELQNPLELNGPRFKQLRDAADLLETCGKSHRTGFTKETTLAWVQSLRGVCECCEDLLINYGFKYVLTGKLHSDPLEARFGCYRQLSGANFFISIRQLLDSEKNIRVINKMKDFKEAIDAGFITLSSILPAQTTSNPTDFTITSEMHCNIESVDDICLLQTEILGSTSVAILVAQSVE